MSAWAGSWSGAWGGSWGGFGGATVARRHRIRAAKQVAHPVPAKARESVALILPRLAFTIQATWKSNAVAPPEAPKVKPRPKRRPAPLATAPAMPQPTRHAARVALALPRFAFSVDHSWVDNATFEESLKFVTGALLAVALGEAMGN